MHVDTHNTSFAIVPAKEVVRMATASILEIEDNRRRLVNQVVDEALKAKCKRLFGLIQHDMFSDRDEVLERCPQVEMARHHAGGAMETCQSLRDFANYLLSNDRIPEDQKVIHLSVADFRMLT